MLQILLAVIGLTLVSTLGLITISNFVLQSKLQDQRENIRRLDIAAVSIQNAVGRVPGVDTLLAPAPVLSPSGWATLPVGVAGLNATVSGVPFLYCPVAPNLTSAEKEALLGPDGSRPNFERVEMPGGFYGIRRVGNFVIEDNLVASSGGAGLVNAINTFQPIAFIVSAATNGTTPVSCEQITVSNGKPAINGGIVRAVSAPVASSGNNVSSSVGFWVAPGGTGDGSQASPANINTALDHFARYSPSQMTINVVGTNVVSAAAWNRFSFSSTTSGSTLRIIGVSDNPTLNLEVTDAWNIPASTVIQGINIVGPTVVVGPGDTLLNSFNVSYITTTGTGSSVNVLPGGKFVAGGRPGTATVDNVAFSTSVVEPNFAGLLNRGTLNLNNTNLAFGGNVAIGVVAGIGSVTDLSIVRIGSLTRSSVTPVLVENDIDILRTDDVTTVIASSAGFCMVPTDNNNPSTRWAQLIATTGGGSQIGGRSAIVAEAGFTRPALDADPAVLEAYQNDFNSRSLGRRMNASNFICS